MKELLKLPCLLLLGITSNYLSHVVHGHAVLRHHHRPWREEYKTNRREYKANHRKLQKPAAYCTDYPTTFSTSLYVNHVGDGTPFQQTDLDLLLQMALLSFNQIAAETCDYTYRTLQAVSVTNVFYSEELDFVRLRYDLTGQCDGCVPYDPESGIGPLFGGYENLRRERQLQQSSSSNATRSQTRRGRGIKGINHHHNRERQRQRRLQDEGKQKSESRKKQSYSSPCDCVSERQSYRRRGPTPSEFAVAFNDMIEAARQDGALSGVSFVEDVFEAGIAGHSTVLPTDEARELTCTNQQDFVTDVWVEFEMGRDLTPTEKLPMEVAILETFNEMNLVSCDVPYFRMVTDVTYVETRSTQDKLQMKFSVSGKCVNCNPATLDLFQPHSDPNNNNLVVNVDTSSFRPPSRTLLLAEIERLETLATTAPFMVYRQIPTSCVCPLNTDGLPLRSPTTREFAQILQASINTLANANRITSVSQVVRVEENEIDATCSSDVTTFVSTVFADFAGQPELLKRNEINTLEDGFKQTYDELIFNSCDQYFRTISQVRLIPGVSKRRRRQRKHRQRRKRGLQATNVGNAANSTDVPDLQSEAPSVYMVAGECRGCPVRSGASFSLLDDAFRFRKLMVGGKQETIACYSYGSAVNGLPDLVELNLPPSDGKGDDDPITRIQHEERRLQQCLCAPGTLPDTPFAPTAEDFRVDYNVKITQYNKEGTVEAVQEVTQLEELPPGFVQVGFSILYGNLERLGTPTAADYGPLLRQTNSFYRRKLIAHYEPMNNVTLRAVTITRGDTTAREDLDMLQVDYNAELIFKEAPRLPTPEELTSIMARLDYVDYITEFIWALNTADTTTTPSVFGRAHSVRFAGRESKVVDLELLFTVRSDRTNDAPSSDDRQGLGNQVNQFYLEHLRDSGLFVVSFMSHIDAEDVAITGDGLVLVDFDATVVFSMETEPPSDTDLLSIMESADLDALKEQLSTASRIGTGVFNGPFEIVYSEVP